MWRNALLVPKTWLLNLETLAWPTSLTLDYWDEVPNRLVEPHVLLGAVALVGAGLVIWSLRHRRQLLFGIAWCCLALAPSSQVIPHHILRSDRFLYLPLVGLAIALGVAIHSWLARHGSRRNVWGVALLGIASVLLWSVLSSRQLQTWRNNVTVWEQCLRVCQHNAVGYAGLADGLADEGQYELARTNFEGRRDSTPRIPKP